MSLKDEFKRLIKLIWSRYKEQKIVKTFYKNLRAQINNSDVIIKELTSAQKDKIVSFWVKNGIDNIPLEWHKMLYSKTGKEYPEFIPEITFQRIVRPEMNDYIFAGVWSDKAYIDYFIKGVKTARSIIRNVSGRFLDEEFELISIDEAQRLMGQYKTLVIKPATYTDTGKDVKLLKAPYDLTELTQQYKQNFVIQLPLKQHEEIAKLNPSSINTLRINSVLFDTEAHVMSAFIKVGQTGEFADNSGHDRFFIGISEKGVFYDYAIDHNLKRYTEIPSGYCFAGKKIPYYNDVCKAVEKAHKCIPHFGFAFWDVAINEDGEPVIVEVNLRYPDVTIPQVAGNPFLGKYTEDIMTYINRYV